MNQGSNSAIWDEAWSDRYERLRACWFIHEHTCGQALFIRHGMAAWIKAWSVAEPCVSRAPMVSSDLELDTSPPVELDGELQRRLAHELANLILHRQQEVLV